MSSYHVEQKLVVAVYLRQGSIISAWWRTAALLAAIGIAAVEISGVAGRKSGSQGEVSSPLSQAWTQGSRLAVKGLGKSRGGRVLQCMVQAI